MGDGTFDTASGGGAVVDGGFRTSTLCSTLTANVMPEDAERARSAGLDGFIGKPIDRKRCPEQIRRIVQEESVWEPR